MAKFKKDRLIVAGVDLNKEAFSQYKSLAELKGEKEKVFEHLPAEAQDAAYEELANKLGIGKAPVKEVKPAVSEEIPEAKPVEAKPAK